MVEEALTDCSSAPRHRPTQLGPQLISLIEQLRRDKKWLARLISVELAEQGHRVSVATVHRWLVRFGINRRRDLDVDGENLRAPSRRIIARYPGHMMLPRRRCIKTAPSPSWPLVVDPSKAPAVGVSPAPAQHQTTHRYAEVFRRGNVSSYAEHFRESTRSIDLTWLKLVSTGG